MNLEFIRKVDKIHENQNTTVYCIFNDNRTSYDADRRVFLGIKYLSERRIPQGIWLVWTGRSALQQLCSGV